MLTTILTFIVLLSVLILIHELGHFLAAKCAGVRVEEFGIGFPPRLCGKRIGETIYSLNLLPIGGFVRLTGEEGDVSGYLKGSLKEDDPRSFANQTNFVKASILTGGVLMNFFLGVFLVGIVFAFLGVPDIQNVIELSEVVLDAPAAGAGLKSGDLIQKFQFQKISSSEEFVEFINQHLGEEVVFEVRSKEAEVREVTVVPRLEPPEGEGPLGIVFVVIPEISYHKIALWQVPGQAVLESLQLTGLMFGGVVRIFRDLVMAGEVPKDITGPVGIARLTGEVAKQGFFQVVNFAALLSINLGVINILPFPGLDGGRLSFVLAEAVLRRKIKAKYQKWVHTIGIAALLLLMLIVTFYDILRFL